MNRQKAVCSERGSEFEWKPAPSSLGPVSRLRRPKRQVQSRSRRKGFQWHPDLHAGSGKYYAGGDIVAGPRRVCDAIGSESWPPCQSMQD
jgi:hypothetical protein